MQCVEKPFPNKKLSTWIKLCCEKQKRTYKMQMLEEVLSRIFDAEVPSNIFTSTIKL
jgi:hypothetical protein